MPINQEGEWIEDDDDMTGDEADPSADERGDQNDVNQTDEIGQSPVSPPIVKENEDD